MKQFNAYIPNIAGVLTLVLLAMVFGSAIYISCTYAPDKPKVKSEERNTVAPQEEEQAQPVKKAKPSKSWQRSKPAKTEEGE